MTTLAYPSPSYASSGDTGHHPAALAAISPNMGDNVILPAVGKRIYIQWDNGEWVLGTVIEYDPASYVHVAQNSRPFCPRNPATTSRVLAVDGVAVLVVTE